MTLEKIISELHFTDNIEQAVLSNLCKKENSIAQIAESAYCGENFAFNLCSHGALTRLTVTVYLLKQKYNDYASLNIPDYVIFETFRDVSLRAALYYKVTGETGISKDDVIWFRHIMNNAIFKIDSLQFQPFEMLYLDEETIGEPYMLFSKTQKETLPGGTPVLNCHIQHGADLTPQAVKMSFQNAKRFFAKYFPSVSFKAFLCYSWLLYPPMLKHLPETSKIKQFADHFTVIGTCSDSDQAIENILGTGKIKALPANATRLQKLAVSHSKDFGFACGIITI